MPDLPFRLVHIHFREAVPHFIAQLHIHRQHQVYVCLHGTVTITIAGAAHELHGDEMVAVPPEVEREVVVGARAAGYLVLLFEADAELDLAGLYGRSHALPADLRDDARALVAEVRHPGGGDSRLLCTVLSLRLLLGLRRAARPAEVGRRLSTLNASEHQRVVAQAEAFMQRNLHRPLRRAEIAASVRLSEPHLGRLFLAVTGRSVVDRLTEIRIEHAKALLRESTQSVTQIAGEVGLSSFSHFSYMFRRLVGVSPSAYRRTGGKVY
jgi:AraC-like DNA-binding protein